MNRQTKWTAENYENAAAWNVAMQMPYEIISVARATAQSGRYDEQAIAKRIYRRNRDGTTAIPFIDRWQVDYPHIALRRALSGCGVALEI